MDPRNTRVLALGVIALAVAACSGPGAGIANRIRDADSSVIQDVQFASANFFGHPEEIYVYLVSDATDAQIVDVWCNVIVQAGIDHLSPERVGFRRGGAFDASDADYGSTPLDKPACTSDVQMLPSG